MVKWFSLEDAVRMVMSGEIVNSIAVAGSLYTPRDDVDSLRPVDAAVGG